jgi:Na+/phosphate symporter
MVVSGEPDKGTENISPGRKLVYCGSYFDRSRAQDKKHELGNRVYGTPRQLRSIEMLQSLTHPLNSSPNFCIVLTGCQYILASKL